MKTKHIIPLLALGIILGCGTKKKSLEKQKEETSLKVETEKTTDEVKVLTEEGSTTSKVDSTSEKNEVTITDIKEKDVDIEADSTGVVTVIEEKTSTGTKTTFSGVKNVSVRDKTTNERNTLKEQINVLRRDSINYLKKDSTRLATIESIKLDYESRIKKIKDEKEVKNVSLFWILFPWILLLLVLIWYNRKRIGRLIRGSPV